MALFLTAISVIIGFALALVFAYTTDSNSRAVRWITITIVELGRGFPLLLILYLVYQGLPQLHLTTGAKVAAIVAFTWNAAAYATEIIRASLGAVPRGQSEAAAACGFDSVNSLRFIILPQASRVAIPPLMNVVILMFQATSLAFVITIPEVMQRAYYEGSLTFDYLNVFICAAIVYAMITIPAALLVTQLERHLSRHLAA